MRRTGNRFSVNAISAISAKGRMHFMVFAETFVAKVMCRFLDRLIGHFQPQDPPRGGRSLRTTALMWSAHGWPITPTGSSCAYCPRAHPN
ncbi:hypothetical protein [Streptomyces albidoflavus]|uniref:hypothetical protein n=1 Tax=Streptomyces albidoflavus TaxID=1886 RepID=UPI0030F39A90